MKIITAIVKLMAGFFLLISPSVSSQNTVIQLFDTARVFVNVIDGLGIQINYLDFNVLTQNQLYRETTRTMYPQYGYSIIAYGNENIGNLDVELYESKAGEWSFVQRGTPLTASEKYVSMIDYFEPKEQVFCMLKVVVKNFEQGKDNGRYFLVVGEKLKLVTLKSYSRFPVKFNTKSLKRTPTGKTEYIDYSFKIGSGLVDVYNGLTLIQTYDIVENLSTKEQMDDSMFLYSIKDIYGKYYTLIINVKDSIIAFYEVTDKSNIFEGWIYTLSSSM